eukprot:g743.t1
MPTATRVNTQTAVPLEGIDLTLEQKRQLYRDGFIILKGAVSKELTSAARKRIKAAKRGENLSGAKEMTDLVNESKVTPVLRNLMGDFDPVSLAQVGVLPPRKPFDNYTSVGYRDSDLPYYGTNIHMDGICTIMSGIPQHRSEVEGMSPDEKYAHYINAGKDPRTGGKTDLNKGKAPNALPGKPEAGKSCLVVGENGGVPLFNDPECTLGIGSFTAFVFVALNDQTRPGCGQTSVLKGAHHSAEKFYQMQRDNAGIMGIEGPGWPRLDVEADNGLGLKYLPDPIMEEFTDESKFGPLERTADGRVWPRPTQVMMEEGDCCITVFHMPHSGSRNEFGTESRKNIIFRIRAKAHNPNVIVNGVSDHLDRGQWGEWLDPQAKFHPSLNFVDHKRLQSGASEWIDPFERSKHLLCHPWEVWEGMQQVVAEERAKEAAELSEAPAAVGVPKARL